MTSIIIHVNLLSKITKIFLQNLHFSYFAIRVVSIKRENIYYYHLQ